MKRIVWGGSIAGILLVFVGILTVVRSRLSTDTHQPLSPVVETVRNIFPTQTPKTTPIAPATPASISIAESFPPRGRFPDERIIVATGDVIPARSVNAQTAARNDFTWSWKNIAPITSQGDITLINLESPLLSDCPVTQEGMVFCGNARHSEGLVEGGVDIANLANNHSANHGESGLTETVSLLESKNIKTTGLSSAALQTVNGMRFAFLGYNDIYGSISPVSWADIPVMESQIRQAKQDADIVIVSIHFGEEYTASPSVRQVELAHAAVNAGADLVIGNHPHWIQPVEVYRGKWITYAHGNTIFDQMWSEETKKGVIGIYTFSGKTLADVSFIPTSIRSYGQPEIISDSKERQKIRSLLVGVH